MFAQRYQGEVAIVTGGASGIGAAVAERLAHEGARVVLFDTSRERLETQAQLMRGAGLDAAIETVDVCDSSQIKAAIARCVREHGRLDVVVHCAGIVGASGCNAHEYTVEEFRRVLDVNLCGSFIVCHHALPHMVKHNYGRILLFASMAGKDGNPGMAGYVASKAGLIGLAKGLGKEYARTGITINAIAPAVIATPMNATTHPDIVRQLTEKIPMQRLGTVEETAALATWICSREASFNTGAVFDLSGGRATY